MGSAPALGSVGKIVLGIALMIASGINWRYMTSFNRRVMRKYRFMREAPTGSEPTRGEQLNRILASAFLVIVGAALVVSGWLG